jgi:hypothetical protein
MGTIRMSVNPDSERFRTTRTVRNLTSFFQPSVHRLVTIRGVPKISLSPRLWNHSPDGPRDRDLQRVFA